MPAITAVSRSTPHSIVAIIDDIQQQFDLTNDTLKVITSQFLSDFNLGLGDYGHAMAMMCVHRFPSPVSSSFSSL